MLKNYNSKMFRIIELPLEFILEESRSLLDCVNKLVEESQKPILIDCQHSTEIDSQGIGAIVQSFKACRSKKMYFGLLQPTGMLVDMLNITGLNKILNILPSLPEMNSPEWDKAMGFADQADLEFTFEPKVDGQIKKLICKGIMHECSDFNRLMYNIEEMPTCTLDFTDLGFINVSCMERFRSVCQKGHVSIANCNLIVEEELRIFQIYDFLEKVKTKSSQASHA